MAEATAGSRSEVEGKEMKAEVSQMCAISGITTESGYISDAHCSLSQLLSTTTGSNFSDVSGVFATSPRDHDDNCDQNYGDAYRNVENNLETDLQLLLEDSVYDMNPGMQEKAEIPCTDQYYNTIASIKVQKSGYDVKDTSSIVNVKCTVRNNFPQSPIVTCGPVTMPRTISITSTPLFVPRPPPFHQTFKLGLSNSFISPSNTERYPCIQKLHFVGEQPPCSSESFTSDYFSYISSNSSSKSASESDILVNFSKSDLKFCNQSPVSNSCVVSTGNTGTSLKESNLLDAAVPIVRHVYNASCDMADNTCSSTAQGITSKLKHCADQSDDFNITANFTESPSTDNFTDKHLPTRPCDDSSVQSRVKHVFPTQSVLTNVSSSQPCHSYKSSSNHACQSSNPKAELNAIISSAAQEAKVPDTPQSIIFKFARPLSTSTPLLSSLKQDCCSLLENYNIPSGNCSPQIFITHLSSSIESTVFHNNKTKPPEIDSIGRNAPSKYFFENAHVLSPAKFLSETDLSHFNVGFENIFSESKLIISCPKISSETKYVDTLQPTLTVAAAATSDQCLNKSVTALPRETPSFKANIRTDLIAASVLESNTLLLPCPDNEKLTSKLINKTSQKNSNIKMLELESVRRTLCMTESSHEDPKHAKAAVFQLHDTNSEGEICTSVSGQVAKSSKIPPCQKSCSAKQVDNRGFSFLSLANISEQMRRRSRRILPLLMDEASYLLPRVLGILAVEDLVAVSQVNRQLRRLVLGDHQLAKSIAKLRESRAVLVDIVGKENILWRRSKTFFPPNSSSRHALVQINLNLTPARPQPTLPPPAAVSDRTLPGLPPRVLPAAKYPITKKSPRKILGAIQSAVSSIQAVVSPNKSAAKSSLIKSTKEGRKLFWCNSSVKLPKSYVCPNPNLSTCECRRCASPNGKSRHGTDSITCGIGTGACQSSATGKTSYSVSSVSCCEVGKACHSRTPCSSGTGRSGPGSVSCCVAGKPCHNTTHPVSCLARKATQHCSSCCSVEVIEESPIKFSPIKLNIFSKATKKRLRRL